MAPFYSYYKNFTAKTKIADYCSECYVFASDLGNYQKKGFSFFFFTYLGENVLVMQTLRLL